MDSKHQLAVFFLCALAGFFGGAFYEPSFLLRKLVKKLAFLWDILFFLAFSACFCAFHAHFALPDIRAYMLIGGGIGLIIYLKSLHRMVAILEKLCYNCFIKLKKRLKKAPKKEKGARSNT